MTDEPGIMTDAEIALLMMAGGEEGLRGLLRVHGPAVRTFLERRFQRDVAEAAFWEASQKAWSNANQYDESRGSLRAWFITIAHRCALDIVKAQPAKRRVLEGVTDPYVPSQPFDLERKLSREQTKKHKALRGIVESLPPAQRRIIEADLAAGGESANAAELARELGLTNAVSVRSQRSKAKATIRKRMREQGLINDEEVE